MHKCIKKLLLGLIIWTIPFLSSFFVWDVQAGGPSVPMAWFNAIMAFTWSIGFAIAAYIFFKDVDKADAKKEGVVAGIVWYLELILLDLAVLVGAFGMAIGDYYPMLLTYLNALVISVAIGYAIKK